MLAGPQAEAMTAAAVDMQVRRNAGLLQSGEQDDAVFGFDRVVVGMHKEGRRRFLRYADLVAQRAVFRQVGRVDQHGEVGPRLTYPPALRRAPQDLPHTRLR